MASYIVESFKGGISDYEDKGIAGAFKYGKNLDIRKRVDSLSCNQALLNETPPAEGFNALIDWWVPSSDGNIYGFARNGRIYKRASNGTWTLVYTDVNGAILGAWEWGISNGKKYLFWATSTNLNRKEIPGLSNWTDVNSDDGWPEALTSSSSHMMKGIGGSVGKLLICDDESLSLVGYDGSYTSQALRFSPGISARCLLQRGKVAVIAAASKNQLSSSELFSFDGLASISDSEVVNKWDDSKPLSLQDIRAMIDTELPLLVDNKGQVFYGDFVSRLPLFAFPGSGAMVNAGGVTNDDDMALFGVYGNGSGNTGVYSYGRKWKNADIVPNLEYQFDCDEIGAIIKVGTNLLISYKSGSTYGVKNIDPMNKATAVYRSLDLKKPKNFGIQKTPVWGAIVLTMKPLPAGCSVGVKYRLNKNGVFKDANLSGGSLTLGTEASQEAVFFVGDKGNYEEIELTLTPNGNTTPEIYKVESTFE